MSDLSFLFSFKHVACYDRTKGDRATSIPGAAQFGKRGFPCEQAPDTRGVAEDFRERERDEGGAIHEHIPAPGMGLLDPIQWMLHAGGVDTTNAHMVPFRSEPGSSRFREVKQPAYEIEVCRKEPIMTNTPISIFISSAHVDSAFVDRLEADVHRRGRWSSWVWNVLCLLWQEVPHA